MDPRQQAAVAAGLTVQIPTVSQDLCRTICHLQGLVNEPVAAQTPMPETSHGAFEAHGNVASTADCSGSEAPKLSRSTADGSGPEAPKPSSAPVAPTPKPSSAPADGASQAHGTLPGKPGYAESTGCTGDDASEPHGTLPGQPGYVESTAGGEAHDTLPTIVDKPGNVESTADGASDAHGSRRMAALAAAAQVAEAAANALGADAEADAEGHGTLPGKPGYVESTVADGASGHGTLPGKPGCSADGASGHGTLPGRVESLEGPPLFWRPAIWRPAKRQRFPPKPMPNVPPHVLQRSLRDPQAIDVAPKPSMAPPRFPTGLARRRPP